MLSGIKVSRQSLCFQVQFELLYLACTWSSPQSWSPADTDTPASSSGKNTTGDQNRILLDSPPGETSVFPLPTMSVSVVDLPPEMLKEVHNSFPRPQNTLSNNVHYPFIFLRELHLICENVGMQKPTLFATSAISHLPLLPSYKLRDNFVLKVKLPNKPFRFSNMDWATVERIVWWNTWYQTRAFQFSYWYGVSRVSRYPGFFSV